MPLELWFFFPCVANIHLYNNKISCEFSISTDKVGRLVKWFPSKETLGKVTERKPSRMHLGGKEGKQHG